MLPRVVLRGTGQFGDSLLVMALVRGGEPFLMQSGRRATAGQAARHCGHENASHVPQGPSPSGLCTWPVPAACSLDPLNNSSGEMRIMRIAMEIAARAV